MVAFAIACLNLLILGGCSIDLLDMISLLIILCNGPDPLILSVLTPLSEANFLA